MTDYIRAILRLSSPLVLSGTGASFMHHGAVPNVAIEGMILLGSLAAFLGSVTTGSSLIGVITAIFAVILLGVLYAFLVLVLEANVFAIGFVLNVFISGLIAFVLRSYYKEQSVLISQDLVMLPTVNISLLQTGGILDGIFNGHSILIPLSFLLVILANLAIYKTPYGYWLRAAGKKPQALIAVGRSPQKVKFYAFIISSVFCALAGAHLSIGYLGLFALTMVAGRGFIVLAIVFFGRGKPFIIAFVSLIFGAAEALAPRIPLEILPPQFSLMIPYLITLFAVTVLEASDRSVDDVEGD